MDCRLCTIDYFKTPAVQFQENVSSLSLEDYYLKLSSLAHHFNSRVIPSHIQKHTLNLQSIHRYHYHHQSITRFYCHFFLQIHHPIFSINTQHTRYLDSIITSLFSTYESFKSHANIFPSIPTPPTSLFGQLYVPNKTSRSKKESVNFGSCNEKKRW